MLAQLNENWLWTAILYIEDFFAHSSFAKISSDNKTTILHCFWAVKGVW